jgi:1-phosphofructokinase
MIYTLTVSPSLDYYMNIAEFPDGDVARAADTKIELGGKGINVSRVLSVLGVPSTAIIVTGGFVGEKIRSLCDDVNLSYINIASSACSRINVKFPIGEVNAPAPLLSANEIEELKSVISKLTEEDILIISGRVANFDIKKLKTKAKLVFDVSGKDLKDALTLSPFLVKPNHHELCEYFDKEPTTDEDFLRKLSEKILQTGTKQVLVTIGDKGLIYVTENFYQFLPAHKGVVKNAVAAGDSALAGFVAGAVTFDDISKAVLNANAVGAAAAFSEGLPDIENIKILLENEEKI